MVNIVVMDHPKMMTNICLSLAYLISMLEVSNTIYNTICNYIANHPCKDAFSALP